MHALKLNYLPNYLKFYSSVLILYEPTYFKLKIMFCPVNVRRNCTLCFQNAEAYKNAMFKIFIVASKSRNILSLFLPRKLNDVYCTPTRHRTSNESDDMNESHKI